jgi:hypothetical protein
MSEVGSVPAGTVSVIAAEDHVELVFKNIN